MKQEEWKLNFSKRLETILKDKNMSQSELAKKSGLSRSRVNDYIHAKTVPTIFATINMADALDISVESLVACDELVREW